MNTPLAVVAFDYGLKNIGVAFGQMLTGTARELPPLKARDGVPDWSAVAEVLTQWQPGCLLVGLPLNMDGSESELCARARKFANRLHGRFALPVTLYDERLTTRLAKQEVRAQGHRGDYARRPVDSVAARLLLEGWLAER